MRSDHDLKHYSIYGYYTYFVVIFNHSQVSGKLVLVRVGDARDVLLPPLPAAPALELKELVRRFERNEGLPRAPLGPLLLIIDNISNPTVNRPKLEKKIDRKTQIFAYINIKRNNLYDLFMKRNARTYIKSGFNLCIEYSCLLFG